MTVNCPECKSVFRVDPAKVPATGVRARCSVCGGIIAIAAGTLPVSVTPSAASLAISAGGAAGAGASHTATGPSVAAQSQLTPAASPSFAPPLRRTPAFPVGAVATPASGTPAVAAPAMPSSAMPTPAAGMGGLRATPRATPAYSGIAPALTSARPTPASSGAVSAPTSAPATSAPTPAAGKRSINPFLRADPSQRARRLARALVSDLVAYYPQKREEGLRDGTLRQLFRDEIKKSYEEYVEQVGRDVAESAPHFQEALNEILAGGRRLF
jgi:predicted Zn finger-like uncharacterized protein